MLEFLTTKCIGYFVIMGTQTCTFNYLQWMLSEDFWHLSEDFGKFVRRFWEICGQIIPKIFVKEQLTHQCQNRCKLISMKIVTVEVNITCFICYCQRMAASLTLSQYDCNCNRGHRYFFHKYFLMPNIS